MTDKLGNAIAICIIIAGTMFVINNEIAPILLTLPQSPETGYTDLAIENFRIPPTFFIVILILFAAILYNIVLDGKSSSKKSDNYNDSDTDDDEHFVPRRYMPKTKQPNNEFVFTASSLRHAENIQKRQKEKGKKAFIQRIDGEWKVVIRRN